MFDDLRHALRGLASRPGFTVVAVLTLALAIGATTAIFSVVDGVLLRATPVVEFDRLVMVWETDRHTGTTREPASVPDFLDFQRDSRTLAALEGVIGTEVNFAPPQGEPVRLAALIASRGLLPMLGIAPIAGRTFSVAEDQPPRGRRWPSSASRCGRGRSGVRRRPSAGRFASTRKPTPLSVSCPTRRTSACCRSLARPTTRAATPTGATAPRPTSGCRCRPTSRRSRAARTRSCWSGAWRLAPACRRRRPS